MANKKTGEVDISDKMGIPDFRFTVKKKYGKKIRTGFLMLMESRLEALRTAKKR